MSVFESNRKKLHHLADEAGFGSESNMTEAEGLLIKSIATGTRENCRRLEKSQQAIRSDLFEWLVIHPTPRPLLHPKGVRIDGATFQCSLDLEDACIDFPLFLTKCTFEQNIILRRARTRSLILSGCKVKSIQADGIVVNGDIFLRKGFVAEGEVSIPGATISGRLDCSKGRFKNPATPDAPKAMALFADGIKVNDSVILSNGFCAEGMVRLLGAVIGGQLYCGGGTFKNPSCEFNRKSVALSFRNIEVKGSLCLVHPDGHDKPARISGNVMLRHARVGQFIDCPEVWKPTDGRDPVPAALDGFTYDSLGLADGAIEVDFRKEWLGRGKKIDDTFAPQPYTQLAKVLREAGHEERAKQILITRGWRRIWRMNIELGVWNLGVSLFHGVFLGFGYRIRVPLLGLIILAILGTWCFDEGWKDTKFNPAVPFIYNSFYGKTEAGNPEVQTQRWPHPYYDFTDKELKEYPKFQPFVYSLDTLLPIVDLHQEDYWMPTGGYRVYLWVHIGLGWIFTTMTVVGFTGLVRKE